MCPYKWGVQRCRDCAPKVSAPLVMEYNATVEAQRPLLRLVSHFYGHAYGHARVWFLRCLRRRCSGLAQAWWPKRCSMVLPGWSCSEKQEGRHPNLDILKNIETLYPVIFGTLVNIHLPLGLLRGHLSINVLYGYDSIHPLNTTWVIKLIRNGFYKPNQRNHTPHPTSNSKPYGISKETQSKCYL
jgi:hypothetical protein